MISRREVAAGVAVMVAFVIAAMVLGSAWQDRSDREQVARDARQAATTAHALAAVSYTTDIRNWHEKRAGCWRGVLDRQGSIRLLKLSAVANQAVADDGFNTPVVRHARSAEAAAQRAQVRGLRHRVPPRFSCAAAYQKPPAPPGVTPLP